MSDRLFGAACLLTAAGMAWAAQDYAAPISYEPVGPRAFPLLLAGLLALGGLWLVLRPSAHAAQLGQGQLRSLGLTAASVFVYAWLFEAIGFPLATLLMAVPVGHAFGGRWLPSLMSGLGLAVALFLLFDKLFGVVLPTGLLAPWLGGH